MSAIDQLALDLPGVAAPPPEVLAGLNEHDQAAVRDVLTRLIVKTVVSLATLMGPPDCQR